MTPSVLRPFSVAFVLSRLLHVIAMAGLLMIGVHAPAAAQPALTEDELERASRDVAIDVVTELPLVWPTGKFPLRVAFASGDDIKQKTGCQREYEAYVQFINAKGILLAPVSIDSVIDSYVFFGSNSELTSLPAFALEKTWFPRPGIEVQSRNQDRFSHSYQMAYGFDDFIEFGSVFREMNELVVACEGIGPSDFLALALLPSYSHMDSVIIRLFGDRADPTLKWRTQRRLLSAMTRLPNSQMDTKQLRLALIEALSRE